MIASLFRLLIVTGIILIPKVLGECYIPHGESIYTKWTMHFDSPPATIYEVLKGNDETAEAFVKFAAAQKDLVGKVDEGLYESCVGKNRVTYEKHFFDETSVLFEGKTSDDSSSNSTFKILRKLPLIFPDYIGDDFLALHICVTGNASNAYVVAFGDLIIGGGSIVEVRIGGEIKFVNSAKRDMCYEKEVNEAMILLRAFMSSSQSRSEEAPKSDSEPHRDPQIDFPPHEGSKKDDIHQEDTKKDSDPQEDLKYTSSHSTPWILGLSIVVGVFVAATAVLLVFYLRRKSGAGEAIPFDGVLFIQQRDQMNDGQENGALQRMNDSDSE